MPSDANLSSALSFFFNHATSSRRKPRSANSSSAMTFSMACAFALSRSKSSFGVRCTTIPNHGLTSLALFPSSFSHSMLLQASSADSVSLNPMTYSVLVVPTPATWASCVDGAPDSAVRMWVFAVSVGRYQLKVFSSLSLSLGSTNERRVLIRTQF